MDTHSNKAIFVSGRAKYCAVPFDTVSFLRNIHKRHPITHPLGRGLGCILWIQHLIDILPQFLPLFMQYLTILDHVITTLDYQQWMTVATESNSSWHGDAIWWHRSGSTLAQVWPVAGWHQPTKPSSEPILTYHQKCCVAFIWEHFHKKCS